MKDFKFVETSIDSEGLHRGKLYKLDAEGNEVFVEESSYEKIARFIPDEDIELVVEHIALS